MLALHWYRLGTTVHRSSHCNGKRPEYFHCTLIVPSIPHCLRDTHQNEPHLNHSRTLGRIAHPGKVGVLSHPISRLAWCHVYVYTGRSVVPAVAGPEPQEHRGEDTAIETTTMNSIPRDFDGWCKSARVDPPFEMTKPAAQQACQAVMCHTCHACLQHAHERTM